MPIEICDEDCTTITSTHLLTVTKTLPIRLPHWERRHANQCTRHAVTISAGSAFRLRTPQMRGKAHLLLTEHPNTFALRPSYGPTSARHFIIRNAELFECGV